MDKNIYVTKSTMPSFEEYTEEIKDLWDSHWLTNMGVKHQQLQKQYGMLHEQLQPDQRCRTAKIPVRCRLR